MLPRIALSVLLRELYTFPHFLKQLFCRLLRLARNVAYEPHQPLAIGKLL